MHWVLQYEYVPDIVDRRDPFRAEHLALIEAAHERGELLMAGGVGDPVDSGLLLWVGDDPSAAEAFVAADPYGAAGLVVSSTIRRWHVVTGG
jgi:hypothetical protein